MVDVLATPAVLSERPALARFSLRTSVPDAVVAAWGAPLPAEIGETAGNGGRRALKLGPDEWVLRAPQGERDAVDALADSLDGSLVDISDREVTFAVEGPSAADVLAHGMPRDLADLGESRGTRTVFDSVSVVVWRTAAGFDLDVWRSFAPFVRLRLETAIRQLVAGL